MSEGLDAIEEGLREGEVPLPSSSMMDDLRQEHANLTSKTHIDIAVPGYSEKLIARYRLLDLTTDLKRIGKRIRRELKTDQETQLFWAVTDTLSEACLGFFYYDGVELTSIAEAFGPDEPPICYDNRLAKFVGFEESDDARGIVLGLFGGNEAAIMKHGRQLNDWMTDTTTSAEETFLGESSGSNS